MITRILTFLFCIMLLTLTCEGQVKEQQPVDVPRAEIVEVQKAPTGEWLFTVRVFASPSKPLPLWRGPAQRSPGTDQTGAGDRRPFSLDGSTLRDVFSDKVYANLPALPEVPFVGPMEVLTDLNAGGWIQFGLAFPAIPPPPLDQEGKKQPYDLIFEVPELKLRTMLKLDPETLKLLSGKP